jgi:hypothetical protein
MNDAKYIGMDVHTATISAAVRDSSGNLVMEATLETKAETILEFVHGLRGSLHVSFEEGTWAGWLHDLLKPHVTEVLVCDSRKNALLRVGNKNDREDARKLSELLFLNKLHPVYHGETGIRTLKELARSYLTLTRDLTRVMNRLKAIYRGWGIACAGQQVYAPRYRATGQVPQDRGPRSQAEGRSALRRSGHRHRREEPQPIPLRLVCRRAAGQGVGARAARRQRARHESRGMVEHASHSCGLGTPRRTLAHSPRFTMMNRSFTH